MHPRFLLACASLLLGACTGPATVLHNPDVHRVFVDGVEVPLPAVVPTEPAPAVGQQLLFRYYGTSRWDAAPADIDGMADFALQPASAAIEMPAPISLWLFPLDFPLEVVRRAIAGREDHQVPIVLPRTPPELAVPAETGQLPGLDRLVERGQAARIQR